MQVEQSSEEIFIDSRLNASRGVAVDSQNNVLVYDFDFNDSFERVDIVKKFDQEGVLVDEIELDSSSDSIKFAELPNSSSFIGLREDGMLMYIEPEPLAITFLDQLQLRSLEEMWTSPVFSLVSNSTTPFNWWVAPQGSKYNDIAVKQNGDFLDLFITGEYEFILDGATDPIGFWRANYHFVTRVQVSSDFANVIEAQRLIIGDYAQPLSGNLYDKTLQIPWSRTGPGIAVNSNGTVLTALPTFRGDTGFYAYPDLVTFSADFDPADMSDNDPSNDFIVLPEGLSIDSFGMTTDDAGNFYVLADNLEEATVTIFPAGLEQSSQVKMIGTLPTGTGFRAWGDVAVDSINQKAYVTLRDNLYSASVIRIDAKPLLQDDSYEENDTLETAYDLSPNEQTWLSSLNGLGIANDDDWYEINITLDKENLIVELEFTHANGDIDLAVYDTSGNLITDSQSITDNETIDTLLPSAGTYFLRVYPYNSSDNQYDLWWDNIIPQLRNLPVTTFDVINDHLLGGEANLTFTLANQGSSAIETFEMAMVYSDDEVMGNSDDFMVGNTAIAGMAVGDEITDTLTVQLPKAILNANAQAEDPPDLGDEYLSNNVDYIGLLMP
ncbi:MAG: hypothetical protein GVY17_02275, partial [Cyanobacteria bacterium]|nr:hypothetical protein [Cyanobacteria bacterium GSL.Bin21]